MKFTKIIRQTLTGVMALSMVFAFSAGAFAIDSSHYLVNPNPTAPTSPVNVTVVVESNPYSDTDNTIIYDKVNVTLQPTGDPLYVQDVLWSIDQNPASDLDLYTTNSAKELIPFTATSDYLAAIEKDTRIYQPTVYELAGWMFRVNGMIPLENETGGFLGATITTTPVNNGDVIHFYYDCPFQLDAQTTGWANYIYPDASYENGVLTVQLKKTYNWFDNSNNWTIADYENYSVGGIAVTVNGSASQYTNSNGVATFTGLSAGTYAIEANSATYFDYDWIDFDTWDFITTQLIENTNGYSQFTIPSV